MELKQHLFLTGFMGSGKSTAGKKTATLFKAPFIDLDTLIEQTTNKTIARIFKEDGENKFREIESTCLQEISTKKDFSVIALGGGTVCFNDNLALIKRSGILVYIKLPAKALADRIQASHGNRPLLDNLTDEDLLKTVEQLLNARKVFYEQAHIIVNGLNLTPPVIQSAFFDYTSQHNF